MASLVRTQQIRVGVLLTILAALIVGLVFHVGRPSTHTPPPEPALTPAEKVAAQAALTHITPPATFSRYTRWRLATTSSATVGCLPRPAICFGSNGVFRPLTSASAASLLSGFHVRTTRAICTDTAEMPIGTCNGFATIPGYALGFIVSAMRRVHPDQRPGTQVILFAIGRA